MSARTFYKSPSMGFDAGSNVENDYEKIGKVMDEMKNHSVQFLTA
ncbi:MAG: hypothetical protein ACLUKN_09195 [Bacilli bacterium]